MTLLDMAKHCIDHFSNTAATKLQAYTVSYMLMNFDEDPVKALKVWVWPDGSPCQCVYVYVGVGVVYIIPTS